jgi:uncharacterized protein
MIRKNLLVGIVLLVALSPFYQYSSATSAGEIYTGDISLSYRNVTVYAPAVAQTESGYVGVISTITVTIQNNGSGRVFVDTLPLTQIDMQGSARLAVKVAGAYVRRDNISVDDYDFFFVVRTEAPIIGGPSAGAIMTVATIALLEQWDINNWTIMTGMINPDGSIGPIGGIPQKIDAANSVGATRFLIPKGQGTYIKTVYETVDDGIWRKIITKQIPESVAEYALSNYGMEVVEVEDVNDALVYLTGHDFPITEADTNITTEGYIYSMKPLAETLLDELEDFYNNASNLFANTSTDIPNAYPVYYRNQVDTILGYALDYLEESKELYNEGRYYSSTSMSFQSLIDSRFVIYACEYFRSDDGDEYLKSLVGNVNSFYEEQSEIAGNANISGFISLQCVGGAQNRASEAETYISNAQSSYTNQDPLGVLYNLAFAMERSKSVGWWLNLSESCNFNDTGNIDNTTIKNLALEYLEDAQQATVYSSVILQEIGKTSSYLTSAEELLETAQNDLNKGYPASAFFGALQALVKANLAIETIDNNAEEKIPRAKESAGASITEARSLGIEPILAVSYYEYAESLANKSSLDAALIYFKYSGIIAGALSFTNFSSGTAASSRYVGIPEISSNLGLDGLNSFNIPLFFIGVLGGVVIGCAVGLGIGSIIISISKEGKKLGRSERKNIEAYYKRQEQYFPDKQIPRSIKDYYKKQKIGRE